MTRFILFVECYREFLTDRSECYGLISDLPRPGGGGGTKLESGIVWLQIIIHQIMT